MSTVRGLLPDIGRRGFLQMAAGAKFAGSVDAGADPSETGPAIEAALRSPRAALVGSCH
jgi:hypothetical protein